MTPMETMIKARAALITSQIFFGALAMRLKLVEKPEVETMAVDGVSLFFNPDWIKKLTPPEIMGVVAHEVMHCVFLHQLRRGKRIPEVWNMAGDYAINPLLIDSGFFLPEGGLFNDKFTDMSTNKIYDELIKNAKFYTVTVPGNGEADGPGDCTDSPKNPILKDQDWGKVLDVPDKDSDQKPIHPKELEANWKMAINQAATAAKNAGNLPSSLQRLVKDIVASRVDWRTVLRNFLTIPIDTDYSWSRPNRRYIANDLYLPSRYALGMGELVVVVDTSGSITTKELTQFQGELNAILEDIQPQKIYVLYCDAQIAHVQECLPEDLPVTLESKGGGGTHFDPPFNWVEEQGILPAALVYLTDMCGPCTVDEPSYPTLWISTTNHSEARFGRVIKMYGN